MTTDTPREAWREALRVWWREWEATHHNVMQPNYVESFEAAWHSRDPEVARLREALEKLDRAADEWFAADAAWEACGGAMMKGPETVWRPALRRLDDADDSLDDAVRQYARDRASRSALQASPNDEGK